VPKGDLLAADGSWWERRVVGWPKDKPTGTRSVYVNHSTKEASWAPPAAWGPWELLKQPVENARYLIMPQLLLAYKDLFRVSGDRNAELYTGSSAMHSAQLDLLLVRSLVLWHSRRCHELQSNVLHTAALFSRLEGKDASTGGWGSEQRNGSILQ
jgi:hypothetical protein